MGFNYFFRWKKNQNKNKFLDSHDKNQLERINNNSHNNHNSNNNNNTFHNKHASRENDQNSHKVSQDSYNKYQSKENDQNNHKVSQDPYGTEENESKESQVFHNSNNENKHPRKNFFFINPMGKEHFSQKKNMEQKNITESKNSQKKIHCTSWILRFNSRLFFILFFLLILFSAILGRLLYLGFQTLPTGNQHHYFRPRSPILDRHGNVLATTIGTFSVYAHPKIIQNKKEAALALCSIFPHISLGEMMKNLQSQKSFIWLIRHITPEKKEEVQALGIQGLDIHKDYKRVFLHDRLFCHVVGLTDLDQNGLSGLEKYFDHRLKSSEEPLVTSLDLRLQHIVHHHLKETISSFEAQGGNAMIADIHTGEILAMVSLPDFSPYEKINVMDPSFFNKNTTGVYEFGSIMKIVNLSLFLEKGEGGLKRVFDARGCLWVGRFRVTDFQGLNRPMTVYEGFLNSSNLVNAQMALSVGFEKQQQFFQSLGFLDIAPLELKERSKPLVPKLPWAKATSITCSYGYGFAVTPLHVLTAIRGIINGYYDPLTLCRVFPNSLPSSLERKKTLVSSKTSLIVRYVLQQAVLEGKVRKAKANNCLVGAKTGTANCRRGRHYIKGENMTSCVGVFPINDPKYIIIVTIDRPKASAKTYGYATAGWIAAPLVATIIENSVPLLGLLNHDQKPIVLNNQQKNEDKEKETYEEE